MVPDTGSSFIVVPEQDLRNILMLFAITGVECGPDPSSALQLYVCQCKKRYCAELPSVELNLYTSVDGSEVRTLTLDHTHYMKHCRRPWDRKVCDLMFQPNSGKHLMGQRKG
jgi:hypothetical protein